MAMLLYSRSLLMRSLLIALLPYFALSFHLIELHSLHPRSQVVLQCIGLARMGQRI